MGNEELKMNFNITDFFKLFGSIYKIAFILFLSGLFLILSNNEIRELFYLQKFIEQFGVYIGIITLLSGVITVLNIFLKIFTWINGKIGLNQVTKEIIKTLSNLSIEEKRILAYFLAHKTQTSNLGLGYGSFQPEPLTTLIAKGYINHPFYIQLTPYYKIDNVIWEILQKNWEKILYEDEFHSRSSSND